MSAPQKQSTPNLVWYASYGSNLNRERFMCYIKGGTPEGSAKHNKGSRDKSEATESRPISLNFELYFAGRSKAWGNGAVAFIRENPEQGSTLSKMYLITDEQFNDVVMQENDKEPDGSRFVPAFNQLASQSQSILPGNPWYGKLLNIGSEGGWPILTFTTARADLQDPPTAPSEQYVKVMASGIREIYPQMSDGDIVAYLYGAAGIRGNIDLAKIRDWVAVA